MTDSIRSRAGRYIGSFFDLTPAEQEQARADAGKPWRTGYYVASRDWPVMEPIGLTLEEVYVAVKQIGAQGDDLFPAVSNETADGTSN